MASDRRGVIVPLIIIAWLFLQPEPARPPATRPDGRPLIDDVIAQEQYSLSLLQNSTWSPTFGSPGSTLNFTGLQPERGYAWESLSSIKWKVNQQLEYALGAWAATALRGEADEANPVPLYRNVSGYVRGSWRRSKLQETVPIPHLNLTEYAPPGPFGQLGQPRPFDRNITGDHGDVTIKINQKVPFPFQEPGSHGHGGNNVTGMEVELNFNDVNSYSEHELQMYGVYYFDLGQAILTTTSDKWAGVFALPHLALSEHTFDTARALLNETLSRTIQRQVDRKTDSLNPWSSTAEDSQDGLFETPHCDLIVYLQQIAPVTRTPYSAALMDFLEHELQSPTGARVPGAPELRFSMLAFSPDCGYVLESQGPPEDFARDSDHLMGPKMEVQFRRSRQHLLIYTVALALQLSLLMRQMREASTPSTRSRISLYTIGILALGDGFANLSLLLISLLVPKLWVILVGTGFLAFISVFFFGMRFLMDIWQVQAPERERRARAEIEEDRVREEAFNATMQRLRTERDSRRRETDTANQSGPPAATPNAAAPASTNAADTATPPVEPTLPQTLPLPVTARPVVDTGATPLFMPSDQAGLELAAQPVAANQTDMDAAIRARMPSFASLYTRFCLVLLAILFLNLNATSWPATAQRVYFTLLALLYLSFWVPQIHRNVQRNCRHALNWEFVLGQSVLRLVPFLYFYGYSQNVLFTDVNLYGLAMLATWSWIQVVILVSQELLGPRWFIKKEWAPPAYDYHPVLREDEEGATMPIGFSQAHADASIPSSPIQERTPSSPIARRASVAKETKTKGKRIFDCAICMQDLEVPVIEAGASSDAGLAGGLLARRNYMVTPCRHIFHSFCLEGWMKYRLQCPICRETLPSL